ncbi:EI24 domain-containing protein [Agreia sp. PsM10]|uniref:EI24 domain-containing protein n=1 Tax=Agreia sp. PsM10 TaxID=3030533 RepID=UPI00263A4C44|nr:EI24 domain-containing protein [Agreia sp. PsM10]MDN4641155.1 EI24 domain-containing protein [Agreia sp. PsM10]
MPPAPARSVVRRFFDGTAYLGRGLKMWGTDPRLMLVGALPALIVAAVYLAALIVLFVNAPALAEWATPFADGWPEGWRTAVRIAAIIAFVGLGALLVVYTYTAITLAVGDPFYEKIWRSVENRLGGIRNEVEMPFWPALRRGILDAVRILVATAAIGLGLFVLGFIPIVGQTVVPIVGAAVAGWFLALELTGKAFDARGRSLKDRRRALAAIRPTALGFGVASYLVFLIPFGAVFVMPAAVAGATLLSREALTDPQRDGSVPAL